MKYLFITDDIGNRNNANSNIVLAVCDELRKENEVHIFSVSKFVKQRHFYYNGFLVYSFGLKEGISEYSEQYESFMDIFKLIPLLGKPLLWGAAFRILLKKLCLEKYLYFESIIASRRIRKIDKCQNYDRIIAVCEPDISIHIAARLKHPHVSIYQLDPYHTNTIKVVSQKNWRLNIEMRAYSNACNIYLTRLIEREYKNTTLAKNETKWTVVEFPLIRKHAMAPDTSTICFESKKINWLFCGVLSLEYRNPKFALELLKRLGDDYCIYFVGINCRDIIVRELVAADERIIACDSVPNDEIYRIMDNADVLVNIGNNMVNQMPSKIIDYMSTGKPILNIAKNKDCITLDYTARYPFCLDVFESDEISPSMISAVDSFCRNHKGLSIPFSSVELMFSECTPAYVASIIRS